MVTGYQNLRVVILIEDTRFVRAGLRMDGVFLGERDHHGDPLPEFIGARPGVD
jgi:hypothetical protein